METPVKIRGPVADMQDLVNIARIKGKRLLGVDRVKVKPEMYSDGEEYILVVEADVCCKVSRLGNREKKSG
ncbi:MAG: hypothetical protein ABSB71_08060 [Candidatus Bathyarchaeia archaeon]|jgi:hypothetical protein